MLVSWLGRGGRDEREGFGRGGRYTDASTLSSMVLRARAIASRVPANAISRSGSPCWN